MSDSDHTPEGNVEVEMGSDGGVDEVHVSHTSPPYIGRAVLHSLSLLFIGWLAGSGILDGALIAAVALSGSMGAAALMVELRTCYHGGARDAYSIMSEAMRQERLRRLGEG